MIFSPQELHKGWDSYLICLYKCTPLFDTSIPEFHILNNQSISHSLLLSSSLNYQSNLIFIGLLNYFSFIFLFILIILVYFHFRRRILMSTHVDQSSDLNLYNNYQSINHISVFNPIICLSFHFRLFPFLSFTSFQDQTPRPPNVNL